MSKLGWKSLAEPRTERVNTRLGEIIPLCDDLDPGEVAWVVAACFKLLALKLDGSWERLKAGEIL